MGCQRAIARKITGKKADYLLAVKSNQPKLYQAIQDAFIDCREDALRGFLPDEILAKKKQGFGLPFGVWAANNAKLKSLAEDSVRGLVDRNILREDFVDALFCRHLHEHPGYYGEMIWISMMLEQWFRRESRPREVG